MILYQIDSINTFNGFTLQNVYYEFVNKLNIKDFICPFCQSNDFIFWGYYQRNYYFVNITNDNELYIDKQKIDIQRIRCKSCGHTHGILPSFLVPYSLYSYDIASLLYYGNIPDYFEYSLFNLKDIINRFIKRFIISFFSNSNYSFFKPIFTNITFVSSISLFLYNKDIIKEESP